MTKEKSVKILAVSSSGGHWIQLNKLRPFLSRYNTEYMSTDKSLDQSITEKFYYVRDASMWDKPGLLIQFIQIFFVMVKVRPDVVVSTGAAPGFFSLFIGKIMGKKTIWIDSMANAEEMSLAGRKVRRFSDVWLTQWPELETEDGPEFRGQVL